MNNFIEDLESIVKLEINNINEKITGVKFLEILKFNLIPKIEKINFQNQEKIRDFNKKIIIENHDKKIELNLIFIDKVSETERMKIENDQLLVVLDGFISAFVNKNFDSDAYKKINLNSYMGISLPNETFCKFSYNKNTFFIKFLYFKKNNHIENEKKDIILK